MSNALVALKTRKPTGKPPWPMLVLAGSEKCGKSYTAAAFSASDLIDRTFWIEIGEGSADQYGAMPGARYEIVDHDGSYDGLMAVAEAIAALPKNPRKPHAVVVDSVTELWDLLGSEQAAIARGRGKDTITMDQWNAAKRRWRRFLDTIRKHQGPIIFTARYEQVSVMDGSTPLTTVDGTASGEKRSAKAGGKTVKEWKVRAEKNLPFEVDGLIAIPKPRTFYLNGMRTIAMDVPIGGWKPLPDFTLDKFMRDLGLGPTTAGERNYVAPAESKTYVAEQSAIRTDADGESANR